MNTTTRAAGQDPAPHADRVSTHESFFGLFGGPAAWFIQLCGGYALASQPCFVNGARAIAPLAQAQWTWPAMIALMLVAVLGALLSWRVSWQAFKKTRNEAQGDHRHLIETGAGRTRFLALWGVILGSGFALATALTAVAFIMLPRCAG